MTFFASKAPNAGSELYFHIFKGKLSKVGSHFKTQHSDNLGDRKWVLTDLWMVWYTLIYVFKSEDEDSPLLRHM